MNKSALLTSAGSMSPWLANLALSTSASAQVANDDYKALVMIFLAGGNDHYNTIIPFDNDSYKSYSKYRNDAGAIEDGLNTIALTRDEIAPHEIKPINPWPSGRSFAFNPSINALEKKFVDGKLAILFNVGNLIAPLTKSRFLQSIDLPEKLFSHNDQTTTFLKGQLISKTGYGGRITDYIAPLNGVNDIFTGMNVSGGGFLGGNNGSPYRLGLSGAIPLSATINNNASLASSVRKVMLQSNSNLFHSAYTDITKQALDAVDVLNPYFLTSTVSPFPSTPLGDQLKAIAKAISIRKSLGMKRQVFFATLGGFDTHAGMPSNHNSLLTQVGDAMAAFYDATVEMGVSESVTTFTGSDFGRTLSSNGDGSDHGWGSFHMILGGAVNGRRWFGTVPTIAVDGPDDVGSGRLLPTTSVDQYFSTLAGWFGVNKNSILDIVPRINRYNTYDLGFMKN